MLVFARCNVILVGFALFIAVLPAGGQVIHESLKVVVEDNTASDRFGNSVAISGRAMIIGAVSDSEHGFRSGSAYLIDADSGEVIHKLASSSPRVEGYFGRSVAISGTTAIVGEYGSGTAYLFDTATGDELFQLRSLDLDWRVGSSVGISGTTAIVGAPRGISWSKDLRGSAYLFDTTTGKQIAHLRALDGVDDDFFGLSVAICGTIAIVGAPGYDNVGHASGSVYVFDTKTGNQLAKLISPTSRRDDYFGQSVSISGTTVIVGDNRFAGSAHLFDAISGQQLFWLPAPDNDDYIRYFGSSVSISGTTAVVGAYGAGDGVGDYFGLAYVFDTTTGELLSTLAASDAEVGDRFGNAVAVSGTRAIVGAYLDDDHGDRSGSAYLFLGCPADYTSDWTVDSFDVHAFLDLYLLADFGADFNDDGVLDFFDITAFLTAFAAGCS